jgi:hypothetical protein
MGETREMVNGLIADFNKLSLDDKLSFLYESSLLERFHLQLYKEEVIGDYEVSEEQIAEYEDECANERIANLELTNREVLYFCKCTGIWQGLTRASHSVREMALILGVLTSRSPQSLQNSISGNGGVMDKFDLNDKEYSEFHRKLKSLDQSRVGPLLKLVHTLNLGRDSDM